MKSLFSDFSASTWRRFCQGNLCADFMVNNDKHHAGGEEDHHREARRRRRGHDEGLPGSDRRGIQVRPPTACGLRFGAAPLLRERPFFLCMKRRSPEPCYLIPERMKLWTNWRWKSRKAIRSGETASRVPAEMTEKLTPDSGAPKIESP